MSYIIVNLLSRKVDYLFFQSISHTLFQDNCLDFLRCDLYYGYKEEEGIPVVLRMHAQRAASSPRIRIATTTCRSCYTAAFKLKLVEYAETHGNCSAGREFDVSEKLIRDWRKNKAELQDLPSSRRSQRPGIKPYWPELETAQCLPEEHDEEIVRFQR